MTAVKTEIGAETQAQRVPHAPSSSIPKSSVWDAIRYVYDTLVASIASTAGAQILVAVASSALSAERVTTDTATVSWDHGTAAQSKANVVDASITNTKLATMVAASIKGRQSGGGTGAPEDLTAAQARTAMGLGTIATQNANGVAITGGSVTGMSDPSVASDVATKSYVDSLVAVGVRRGAVRAATTANITIATALNNADTLDGVTLATNDLVLVKNQSAPAENGVYVVGASPARATQFDTYDEHPGSLLAVEEGSTNADTMWLCTSNLGGTLNSTSLAFTTVSAVGALIAANNLSDVSNAATARTNLGLSANGASLVTAANYAAMRTLLTLVAGTDFYSKTAADAAFQAIDAQLSSLIRQNSQTAAYTTVLADGGKQIYHPSSDNNARTFTIDSNANVAYPIGTVLTFVNEVNTVTIAITSDTLTFAGSGTTGSRSLAANGMATALKVASTKWVISGAGLT